MSLLGALRANVWFWLLLALAFAMRFALAWADPFLHPWDERFHAAVALNMTKSPFVPMLQAQILGNYDPYAWCCNTVWLHKQPLFMWQMALSMKIFGNSLLAMRLPSVLMGVGMVAMVYRCGFLLTARRDVGLFAAALLAFSSMQLRMGAGIIGMDHNDTALQFYVLLSFWAWSEYTRDFSLRWALLAGAAAGGAVLNKWLLGLAIFLPWGFWTLWLWWGKGQLRRVWDFSLALGLCLLVFVPWQWYILHRWHDLAQHEYEFNRRHLYEALEGHAGTWRFYVDYAFESIGEVLNVLMLPALLYLGWAWRRLNGQLLFAYLLISVFVFSFLSFYVATKVSAHIYFIVPFLLIFLAFGILEALDKLPSWLRRLLLPIAIAAALFSSLNPVWFLDYFSPANRDRQHRLHNAAVYKNLPNLLPKDVQVVMNAPSFEQLDIMFYNPQYQAQQWCLEPATIDSLRREGIKIAVFKTHGKYHLREDITAAGDIFIIPVDIYSHD